MLIQSQFPFPLASRIDLHGISPLLPIRDSRNQKLLCVGRVNNFPPTSLPHRAAAAASVRLLAGATQLSTQVQRRKQVVNQRGTGFYGRKQHQHQHQHQPTTTRKLLAARRKCCTPCARSPMFCEERTRKREAPSGGREFRYKTYLLTPVAARPQTFAVVAQTVELVVAQTVDQIHQELLAGGAGETVRME